MVDAYHNDLPRKDFDSSSYFGKKSVGSSPEPRVSDGISALANNDSEQIDWLFEQLSKEDGIWPSSSAYLRQIISATGDEEDKVLYSGDEEPFDGLSPHMYLCQQSKDLEDSRTVRNRAKVLKDSFQANQFLELTSLTRATQARHDSSANTNFNLLEFMKTGILKTPTPNSHILLPNSTETDRLKEKLERYAILVYS